MRCAAQTRGVREASISPRVLASGVLVGLAAGSVAAGAQQPAPAKSLDPVPDRMLFDVPYGVPIARDRAQAAIAAAVAECCKHDRKLNVAVADSGANLVAFARMDGA